MMNSVLSALNDRMDDNFLTAYWLPAAVFVLGASGMLAKLVGLRQVQALIYELDGVEQGFGLMLVGLLVTLLAFVLRSLCLPIFELFAGVTLPRPVTSFTTRGQYRHKVRTARRLDPMGGGVEAGIRRRVDIWRLQQQFPANDEDLLPTLFGNVLAAAVEKTRLTYDMDYLVWWSRLEPLLPPAFLDKMAAAQAPVVGLLNLCLMFLALAPVALVLLGLIGAQWVPAIAAVGGALLLSRLCYLGAVGQARQLGNHMGVAFDLYRSEILRQLGVESPPDPATERALWSRLTREVYGMPEFAPAVETAPEAQEDPGASRAVAAARALRAKRIKRGAPRRRRRSASFPPPTAATIHSSTVPNGGPGGLSSFSSGEFTTQ